jgi:hypothetical protein
LGAFSEPVKIERACPALIDVILFTSLLYCEAIDNCGKFLAKKNAACERHNSQPPADLKSFWSTGRRNYYADQHQIR